MTESGQPTPGATIPVRVQRHVLALVAVIAALGLLLIGALVWQERSLERLERRANVFHTTGLAYSAEALEALAEADNRALRAREQQPRAGTIDQPVGESAAFREIRSLAYYAIDRAAALEKLHAAWPDPDFTSTLGRLTARRTAFAQELATAESLDERVHMLLGPGARGLRVSLDQLRLLHVAGHDRAVRALEQRRAFGVRALGAVAVLAITLGAVVLWRMLRLIRLDAERQLRLHEELDDYVHMLDQAQRVGRVGLWRADYDHDRMDASPETWDILGLPQELHTMQGLRMSIHPEDRAAYAAAVEGVRTRGVRTEIRYRIVNPVGQTRWFQASAAPQYTDSEGRVVRMSGTVQDITERALAEQELARYRNELEQMVEERTADLRAVNAELEAFCYSVSHDLRGPLRGIDGFSQALLEEYGERLDAAGRDYLQRVRAGVQRMGRLIDDLLNLSRVSRIELQRQEVDLSAMGEAVLRTLRAGDAVHALEWEVQPGMQVWGDAGLLHVLLENLLGNAWKFTARVSHPRIQFGASQQGGETAYHVRDNGAGFDMRFADKLFGAFQRLHDSREFEGTGIGLATAQRIVHRHGGRIWAEGGPGAGATFYFTLATRTDVRA